tara:strand:- start:4122 stop:4343 length:222 start_codon:yes stop_codon:yes gene_type:complete
VVRIHPGSPNKTNNNNTLQVLQKYTTPKKHPKYYVQIVYKKWCNPKNVYVIVIGRISMKFKGVFFDEIGTELF